MSGSGRAPGRGTAAVFAHFDPGGQVSSYVHRYLAQLAGAVDTLVVVSTADLGPAARAGLAGHGHLIMRANEGYDFASWKAGLEHLGELTGYDRIVLANDSVVGPVVDLTQILGTPPAAEFWGITASVEIAPHVQSWFMVYEAAVLRTGMVDAFWSAVRPESHRYQVLRRYEVGQSRLLRRAGVPTSAWFSPTVRERAVAELRYQRWLAGQPAQRRTREDQANSYRRHGRLGRWNPSYGCWDAALTGRLPFVKTELLRDNPMGIDSSAALAALEVAYPTAFEGVRDHLDRTGAQLRRLRRVA